MTARILLELVRDITLRRVKDHYQGWDEVSQRELATVVMLQDLSVYATRLQLVAQLLNRWNADDGSPAELKSALAEVAVWEDRFNIPEENRLGK